jgi:hypothetical protein
VNDVDREGVIAIMPSFMRLDAKADATLLLLGREDEEEEDEA